MTQREPMVFFVAGMVFGCVLGYMVASAGGGGNVPRPAPPRSEAGRAGPPPAASTPAGKASEPDPNELHALESLASRDKTNADSRKQLGNLFMDHEKFEAAARWYREALALTPGDNDMRVDLGACLVNAGKPAEGLVEFETALKNDPNHKKALFNKGVALMASGRPKDAAAVWDDLLKRFPNDPQLAGLREQIEQVRASRQGS